MQDKIYKTGHKKRYYRCRRALRLSLFALGLGLSISAPVLITYGVEFSKAEAQQEKIEAGETIDSSSETSAALSYFA
jgi:hypothetical protein